MTRLAEIEAYLRQMFDIDADHASEIAADLQLIFEGDTTSTRFMEGPYND